MLFRREFKNEKETKERKRNQKERIRPCSTAPWIAPMVQRRNLPFGKVSLCASYKQMKKASLAVETAFVLPLFFMGMVTMISFMDVYKLQTEHLMKLTDKAKTAAMYAYVLDDAGPADIILPDLYSYQSAGGWLRLPTIWLHNTVKVHAWTGRSYSEDEAAAIEENHEEMVYVTQNGSVYHVNEECTYLDLSIHEVSGRSVSGGTNLYGEHYHACEICSRGQSPGGLVYITDTGNRYHNQGSCSGLKRTVRLVCESEVEGMHVCSRCGHQ